MPSTIRGGVREILYTIIQKYKEKQEERKALLMQKINCLVTVTKFIENLDVHVDKSVLENVKQLKEVEETELACQTQTKYLVEVSSMTDNNSGPVIPCRTAVNLMSEGQMLEQNCFREESMTVPAYARLPEHWKEFACGGGAAFCNILISYPLNKLIFRQMMHGVETTFALNQLQKEGAAYLYRGMLPPLMQRSLSMSLMFGVYDECLQPLLQYNGNPYIAQSIAGVVAGCVEATLMPFERLQTLLIHPKYHKEFKNTAHATRHIWRRYGIKEFYRGLVPILMRNGPSNAMFFIIRDEVRLLLPPQEQLFYKSMQDFLVGASIGAFLSTLFYPLNVIKIAMQCELGGPHRTVAYEFSYILRKRGSKFANLYHGALLNISRAFLSWGIINASYEIFRKFLYS